MSTLINSNIQNYEQGSRHIKFAQRLRHSPFKILLLPWNADSANDPNVINCMTELTTTNTYSSRTKQLYSVYPQYQKPPCDFLPLLLHSSIRSFTYSIVPSVTKYVLINSNRVDCKSLEMCTVGPLSMAKEPIKHILPRVKLGNVKLKANFDGRTIIYQESTNYYLASDNLIALPQSPSPYQW